MPLTCTVCGTVELGTGLDGTIDGSEFVASAPPKGWAMGLFRTPQFMSKGSTMVYLCPTCIKHGLRRTIASGRYDGH